MTKEQFKAAFLKHQQERKKQELDYRSFVNDKYMRISNKRGLGRNKRFGQF